MKPLDVKAGLYRDSIETPGGLCRYMKLIQINTIKIFKKYLLM